MRTGFFIVLISSAFLTSAASIAAGSAFLSGTVRSEHLAEPNALVTVTGNNIVLRAKTNRRGEFSFPSLQAGKYVVIASASAGVATATVDLTAEGADIVLTLHPQVIGTVSALTTPRGSGTDLTLDQNSISRSPGSESLAETLLQVPGAARGANGVVHLNGDHGDINYIVDGVPIPQELNRAIGSEFDLHDVSFIEVIEGAYPAQYGERFASIININTRSDIGTSNHWTAEISAGSFTTAKSSLNFHSAVGRASLVVGLTNDRTLRGLDPPNPNSPHNAADNANQFIRYTVPDGNDYLNLTLSHSHRGYQ
ncbi:MAG: carboxypeptidase regulatory-like domain-containing protein, partial [Candidatus Eremiobacteraeota bacterium]|nr:carboxypeptidase regulatory-like domain-containing protein [Candidatus Eremiobacteraeota bacterium]